MTNEQAGELAAALAKALGFSDPRPISRDTLRRLRRAFKAAITGPPDPTVTAGGRTFEDRMRERDRQDQERAEALRAALEVGRVMETVTLEGTEEVFIDGELTVEGSE